jgi:hypothetical protein
MAAIQHLAAVLHLVAVVVVALLVDPVAVAATQIPQTKADLQLRPVTMEQWDTEVKAEHTFILVHIPAVVVVGPAEHEAVTGRAAPEAAAQQDSNFL